MCGHWYIDSYWAQLCFHVFKAKVYCTAEYTASKKYDPRCSFYSDHHASLAGPWREVKVEGVQGPWTNTGS